MHGGPEFDARVVLTDGGVFDNLGTSCLEPGRSEQFSTNVYDVDYIIACDAGRGLLDSQSPFGPVSRLSRSFLATFRKAQDATRGRLHQLVEHGDLQGLVMPYLGQRDSTLPYTPPHLITREQVADTRRTSAPCRTRRSRSSPAAASSSPACSSTTGAPSCERPGRPDRFLG